MVNMTTEVLINVVTLIPIAVAFAITARSLFVKKYPHLRWLSLMWLFATIWCLGDVLAQIFLVPFFYQVACYVMICVGMFQLFLFDSIDRESIDPFKLTICLVIWILFVWISLDPVLGVIYQHKFPNGEIGLTMGPVLSRGAAYSFLIGGIIGIYYYSKMYTNAPKHLKKRVGLLLSSTIFIAVGEFVGYFFGLNLWLIGYDNIVFAIDATLKSIIWLKFPELGFVLPFKVYNLAIVETDSAMPLYTKMWRTGEEEKTDGLFPSILQGISTIVNESLQKGAIQEIRTDRATIMLKRDKKLPIGFLLVANKFSKTLIKSLEIFARRFFEEFKDILLNPDKALLAVDASKLVDECFAFVPEYY